MKVLRVSMPLHKADLWLNLYLLYYSDTLLARKIHIIVNTSLLHRVHMASVNNFDLMGLVEDGSDSYRKARQKEVWLAGIA